MSSRQPDIPPGEPKPKKTNTALIVLVVLAVLALPILCICGLAGVILFWGMPIDGEQTETIFQSAPTSEVAPMEDPFLEAVPPAKAVPPPIKKAVLPVESAPQKKKPLPDDEATSK